MMFKNFILEIIVLPLTVDMINHFNGTYFSGLICNHSITYRISSIIRRSFFLPKQSQRSRSVLQDGSRSLGLFRMGKICIIAKFHRTDLVI